MSLNQEGLFYQSNRFGEGSGSGGLPTSDQARETFEHNSAHPGESTYRETERQGQVYVVKEKPGGEEVWQPVRRP